MFYRPGIDDHGLPHDPFKGCVVPRPIGWISTLSPTGQANLAPYSQFNNLTFDPPYVMFSANQTPTAQQKDTVKNTEATGKFCWNLATYDLREAVNVTAEQTAYGVDEFEKAGLAKVDSTLNEVDVKGEKRKLPMIDIQKTVPIARCGYYEYAVIRDVFEMKVPGLSEDVMAGLEGNSKKMLGVVAEREKNGVMRGEDAEVKKEDAEGSK
ncbi:hypothetical protein E8E11_007011 [Didymella keratinophila]|nr:hypothetical protein E8E11_007011 [Didymella keratinophila]